MNVKFRFSGRSLTPLPEKKIRYDISDCWFPKMNPPIRCRNDFFGQKFAETGEHIALKTEWPGGAGLGLTQCLLLNSVMIATTLARQIEIFCALWFRTRGLGMLWRRPLPAE